MRPSVKGLASGQEAGKGVPAVGMRQEIVARCPLHSAVWALRLRCCICFPAAGRRR